MKRSNSSHFLSIVVGICLIASPLFLLASALVSPAFQSDEARQLAVIAEDPNRYYLFTILILVGTGLLVPVALGLMSLARDRSAKLGVVGGSLAIVGALVGVGDSTSQLLIWQMVAPGSERAQMVALLTRFDSAPGAAIIFRIGGLSLIAGMVILAIGLYRARSVPAWAAAGVAVGIILNIAGFVVGSSVVVVLSSAILLVSLGWIGRLMFARSDEEWASRTTEPLSGSGPAVRERPA